MNFKKGATATFLALFAILQSLNANSVVLINEILANGLNDPDSEWVELFNNGSSVVNLTNWNISESFSSNFTLNTTIATNEFIILAVDFNTFNSTYPNVNLSGIKIIDITISNFNLADSSGEVSLYNSSGSLVDSIAYVQATGKTFENISIGRYPDASSNIFNLSTITPGAKNDNQAPHVNKWVKPSRNNTNISGIADITINITDDTTQVNSTIINFNGTNFSMTKNGDLWSFPWNTSLNIQKLYNITLSFNDSYGKAGFDALLNISVNNSPAITSFSPSNLTQALAENSTLKFSANASDPDDVLLNFSWLIDNTVNSTSPINFSYSPGFSDNGTHTINVTVKDTSLNQVSMKWTVIVTNVNIAPVLEPISNKLVSKNVNLSFNISATDSDNNFLTFSSNHSGIALSKFNNSLAEISWKPTNLDLGNNTINFTASDGTLIDSKVVIITVNATSNIAPNMISSPKTIATLNERYTYDVDATDADNDTLRFSVNTNASGMSIDSSAGVITFTPSAIGFFAVNVSVTDFIEITNQSFNLNAVFGSGLKISDVDVKIDGKKRSNINNNTKISKEAEPASSVEFKITVKNDFTKSEDVKIENIEVKTTIEDIDNDDDLEEESKEFDLNAQDDRTVTLKFTLPLNVDEGTFDVLIEAGGEDEKGTGQKQHFEIELEVAREKHDLRFLNFDLSPKLVNCNRIVDVDYKIMNIGLEDEEDAVLEIKSDGLGLLFNEENITIDSGTEDNIFLNSAKLKINEEVENGIYPIVASIYTDDGKLRDTKTKEIKFEDCIKKSIEKQEILLTAIEQQKATQVQKERIQAPAIEISFKEADASTRLLVLSTFIFTTFFVFTAILLFARF